MKFAFLSIFISLLAHANDDYYLDIYDSQKNPSEVEVVYEYKGCKNKLIVQKKDLDNTEIISKWLKTLRKQQNEGFGCVN